MKKIICLLFGIIIVTMTFAQTQQGIVKTRGRVVNGQVVPGTRLTGATITLNIGNPLVSGDDGDFSFNVPSGKTYSLVVAKKQDPEYTHRSFSYSASNPFYVVLEDEAQRQADINAATRKVRRTLTAQLQAREDEIEALKEQNKLTEAEYQKRLQELYDNQSKSEQLVKEMAERYASTDYDQLDEFNRQVQMYIEEGELQKADSMIRSKGNMEQRVAEYHNVVAANQKARQQLEQSEAGAAKTYEDLAQDLLRRSEIFLQSFQQDSALYYLKMRADLDSTNIYAVVVYAEVCRRQKAFFEAEKYFNICLKICQSENEEGRVALLQEYLGLLYNDMHDYYKSLEYYCRASDAFENLSRSYPDRFQGELASVQKELAIVYREIQDYPNAEKSLKLALRNYELLDLQNQNAYRAEIAAVFSEFGNLYLQLKDYTQSEHYYKSSLENYTLLFQQDPDTYISSLAEVEANLGILYKDIHNYDKSTEFELSALAKYENLFALNPDAYRELVRGIQLNLGDLYMELKEFASSLKYFEQSLENAQVLFQKYNEVYRPDLALVLNNLGVLYLTINDIGKAITFFQSALDNYEVLYKQSPNVYIDQIALIQQNLGAAYFKQFDFDHAEYYLKLAFDNTTKMPDQNTQAYRISMADIQTNLGLTYMFLENYTFSEASLIAGLSFAEYLSKKEPEIYRPKLAVIQRNLGLLYSNMCTDENLKKFCKKSLKYYKQSIQNYEILYQQDPNVYREDLAKSQFGIALIYYDMMDYKNAEFFYASALGHFMLLCKENADVYKENLYLTLLNFTYLYIEESKFHFAHKNIDNSIKVMPKEAKLYDLKGSVFLAEGKNEDALAMWKKVLELNPDFLKDYPDGTELSNGLKKLGLIE